MSEFLKVVHYKEAQEAIRKYFPIKGKEKKTLLESLGLILAEDLFSPEDIPSFNRSTVDGYAVNSKDTFGSSESLPGYFKNIAEVLMGEENDIKLGTGECAWIPTGGMLPATADAAVMLEYSEQLGEDTVLLYRAVGPGENIMQQGEDIKKNAKIFSQGKKIRPQDIGLLASLGIQELDVYKPLRVAVISTGDEIIPLDQPIKLGQIRDTNSYTIAAAINETNNQAVVYPIIKDDYALIKRTIEQALAENDLILISGGSSVGTKDMTLDVLLSLANSELLFHGIAIRPGKPTLAVKTEKNLIIGLPGHPVSAFMIQQILCSPFLAPRNNIQVLAELESNIASQAGRDDFVAVKLIEDTDMKLKAKPLIGKSGLMSILSMADAYIHIPYEQQGIEKGQTIKVTLF